MVTALPRFALAAPTSGAGKTTVAFGLMAALRARGLDVAIGGRIAVDEADPRADADGPGERDEGDREQREAEENRQRHAGQRDRSRLPVA